MKKPSPLRWVTLLSVFLSCIYFSKVQAQAGTHLNFDGINDYVNCPTMPVANQSFSVEFWAKRNGGLGSYQYLFSQGTDNGNDFAGVLFRLNNVLSFSFWGDDLDAATAITDANWHHYAVTFNSVTKLQCIYIDGTLNVSRTASANTTASGTLFVGGYLGASQTFNGNIEDFRVWNYALAQDEVTRRKNCELPGTESGLIRYYKFNQGTGSGTNTSVTSLTDATTGSNHGVLTNFTLSGSLSNWLAGSQVTTGTFVPSAPTATSPITYGVGATPTALTASGTNLLWYTSATGGSGSSTAPTPSTATAGTTSYWVTSSNANGCHSARTKIDVVVAMSATHLHFDGSNDYVNCGIRPAFDFSVGTVQAWVKPAASGNNRVIVANRTAVGSAQTRWSFHLNQSGGTVGIWNGSAYSTVNVGTITAGTWYHFSFVVNASSVDVYKSGAFAGTIAAGMNTGSTGNPLIIGAADLTNAYPGEYWSGDMDEVRIWNRALSADEILRTRNCELQGNETGLVGYYKMNRGAAAGTNTGLTTLSDATANAFNGSLVNFALTGAGSNWLSGSPVNTGSTIPATPVASAQAFCGGTTVAKLLPAPSATVNWYSDATSGGVLSSSTAISASATYYVAAANAAGCESARTPVSITINASSLATANQTSTLMIAGITNFPSCTNLMTSINPTGASPVSGSTTAKVWIEASQPAGYVKRHYEITPASNAGTATANITLYFTQAEFTSFNSVNTVKLPTGPADLSGIANLLIEKRSGTSSNGTGLPNTYSGSITTIDPVDANIVWNATASRWEASFDVTGFSGFFVKTSSFILPVNWISFTANLDAQKNAQLAWKVSESHVFGYEVERSVDGNSFGKIGALSSAGTGTNTYRFVDDLGSRTDAYYRIKQTDRDGKYSYSKMVRLSEKTTSVISLWPNPAQDKVMVTVSNELLHTKVLLQDVFGKNLQTISVENNSFQINIGNYSSGLYLLKFENGEIQKLMK